MLGYPNYRTLKKWYSEYQQDIIEGIEDAPCTKEPKYNKNQQEQAVKYYLESGKDISRTVRTLGYPCRTTLRKWINEYAPQESRVRKSVVQYTQDEKIQAVAIKHLENNCVKKAADKLGIERSNLNSWEKELLHNRWDNTIRQ